METDYRKAEYIRIAVKQLRWAAQNLAAYYETIRTEDNPPIEVEDPNQLKLFTQENDN
jgi:hypothetical protein